MFFSSGGMSLLRLNLDPLKLEETMSTLDRNGRGVSKNSGSSFAVVDVVVAEDFDLVVSFLGTAFDPPPPICEENCFAVEGDKFHEN